jgi:copper chaperone CopZ
METIKFTTNIKCSGCTATVTPFLNNTVGEDNWEIDLQSTDKLLNVVADDIAADEVRKSVEAAGYKAELLQ